MSPSRLRFTDGRLRRTLKVLREQGVAWAAYRAWDAAQRRLGILERRMPRRTWNEATLKSFGGDGRYADDWLASPPPFCFDVQSVRQEPAFRDLDPHRTAVAESNAIAHGHWRVLGEQVEGNFPPLWNTAQLPVGKTPIGSQTAQHVNFPSDKHWATIDAFVHGDIKRVWEPARFAAAFAFIRASVQAPHNCNLHVERFWTLADSFFTNNPPNHGAHWKCGQELSLRLIAWCFGLYGSRATPALSVQRVERTAQLAAASAERIERHIHYALSQKNNHGISEAAGLFTVGLIFPKLNASERWVRTGRHLLEQQVSELIYADGAFSQHSANYHRLMLQTVLWCIRLGELNGVELSRSCIDAARRSSDFLYKLVDVESGRAPNYGENDGALTLPLSAMDRGDYRPVLQSAAILLEGSRRYPAGSWDEEAMWLFGGRLPGNDIPAASSPAELRGGPGGCHTMRSKGGNLAAIRCTPSYRHRPGHADALHVDIWWRGLNIALDAGTYSYNAAPPWNHPLAQAHHHNTVTVDGQEPMERASRFLWTDWYSGQVNTSQATDANLAVWEGSHDGYRRAAGRLNKRAEVCFRRAVVRVAQEHWLIIDDLCSAAEHDYRLHWLLDAAPHRWLKTAPSLASDGAASHILALETRHGNYQVQFATRLGAGGSQTASQLRTASEDSAVGWHCPSYGVRRPALSVSTVATTARVQFFTLFGPSSAELRVSNACPAARVRLPEGEATIGLRPDIRDRLTSAPPATWDKQPMIQTMDWRPEESRRPESRRTPSESHASLASTRSGRMAS